MASDRFMLYLAGPITGISWGDATDWRQFVASDLPQEIVAISPLRGKNYLANLNEISQSYGRFPLSTAKGITCRDVFDIRRSDAVLVNFIGAKVVSIGSVFEIGLCHALGKPIILAMEESGNPHDHPMVRESASFILSTLKAAIDVAIKVILPWEFQQA